MKKLFIYIENLWIGNDGKPSIKRILAIIFSIDLVINFHKAGGALYKMIEILMSNKVLDPAVVTSISSFLANEAMIMGIEAGLIAGLLSLTTYQSLQLNKPCDPGPISQISDTTSTGNVIMHE